ncbi:MAG: hydantoinase B/oxoprolinase family protein [Nitrososphaerales archaeon]
MSQARIGETIDPFVLEIIRSGLVATTDEMKTNLMRTAYNPIVYESLDFTVAITDADGNLISIGLGLPSFIRGISDTVKALIKFFGSDIHPGDILLTNDSYTHGSHLNHVIAAMPVFHGGEIIAYACSEPHWADIGGVLGGKPTDIYSEGLQIPYVKIYDKGVLDKQILSIIAMNVRNSELALGDFRGQIACVRTGEKRILHLASKYGAQTLKSSMEAIMDRSEEFSRKQVSKIPEGAYEAEQFMDDDGIDVGSHILVKVKIEVKGEAMTVDLSEVGKQVRGYYNSGAGVSGVQMGFKSLVCPTWYPINDGSFRSLKVILPPGTVVSARKPAAMRWWMTIPMTLADTMWKAMAPAIPDRIAAGHHADLCVGTLFEVDPKTKRPILKRVPIGGLLGGGFGATLVGDGVSAVVCLNDGDTHNAPVESAEAHNNSAIYVRRELRPDSGGPGNHRGGLGVIQEIACFSDAIFNSYIERTMCPPWGAFGGKAGFGNCIDLSIPTDDKPSDSETYLGSGKSNHEHYPNEKQPNSKLADKYLASGSRVAIISGGGGGYGSPLDRDQDLVFQDYLNGYISLESARNDYGVVIESTKVDSKATRALRERNFSV